MDNHSKFNPSLPRILTIAVITTSVVGASTAVMAQYAGLKDTSLTVSSVQGRLGSTVIEQARLTDFHNGQPIAGQPIYFSISQPNYQATLGPRYTDANGIATCQIILRSSAFPTVGTYSVRAEFLGNGIYMVPQPHGMINVTR